MRPGRFKLHLAGSVGPVAHLIFQALDEEFVLLSGWGPARKKKAGKTFCVWARIRKASHMGAEQNHLCPVIRYSRELPISTARVVLARTSEPPCFSVIPIPSSTPRFSVAGMKLGS